MCFECFATVKILGQTDTSIVSETVSFLCLALVEFWLECYA